MYRRAVTQSPWITGKTGGAIWSKITRIKAELRKEQSSFVQRAGRAEDIVRPDVQREWSDKLQCFKADFYSLFILAPR